MQRFNLLPEVIKNLIIINGLFFIGLIALESIGIDLSQYLMLYNPSSGFFKPYQLITHMFMHDLENFRHIFFNMFALWMFGYALENIWGSKRFLQYYILTGLGAALLHFGAQYVEFQMAVDGLSAQEVSIIKEKGYALLKSGAHFPNSQMEYANNLLNRPSVGASGAVFGILLAFGMLFPNQPIFFIFLPIPIKAKYFVAGYGILELISGFTSNGNVAHFAHLGGLLFGYLILRYWKSKRGTYY